MTLLLIALMFVAGLGSLAVAAIVAAQHWLETRRILAARRQAVGH